MRSLIRVRRAAVAMVAAAGAGALAAGMVTAATGATAAGAAATVAGVEAPLPANAGSNPGAGLNSLSCASAGNCTTVGSYVNSSGHRQGLLLTQTAGTWATGVEAVLPANAEPNDPGAVLDSVSCASAGNCTVVGTYSDSSGNPQGLLLTQTAGTWATGVEAALPANAGTDPGEGAVLGSVSCASAGNCTATGTYSDSSGNRQGLLLTQTAGTWASGVEAALPANGVSSPGPGTVVSSVSCASAGNCTAAGSYPDTYSASGSTSSSQGLLLTQTAGTWATGVEAPLPANAVSGPDPYLGLRSLSCASAGNCTVVGTYSDSSGGTRGLLLTQTAGTWATGVEAPLPANAGSNPGAGLDSVSCASAGDCTTVGSYLDSSGSHQGLLLTQTAGTWATGVEAAPPANAGSNPGAGLDAVSCASAGNCTATGHYTDSSGHRQGLLLTQTAGTWATEVEAAPPANAGSDPGAGLDAVSCASAGNCTAVGNYTDSSGGTQGLLAQTSTATSSPSPSPSPTSTATSSPSPSPSPTSAASGFAFGGNVGHVQGSMTAASVTVPAGGVPAGSLVVVGIASPTAPESFTASDSAGNTYTLDNSRTSSSPYGYQFHSLISAPLPQGATISVHWGGASIDAVIEAAWFSTGYASVSKDLAVSGHGSGTALSTGNTKATAHASELVVGMGTPRMPGTAAYHDDTADGYSQALFTGDSKQSNDLSYKVASSAGVFDYKPTISVSSSWVDLLTTYHGS